MHGTVWWFCIWCEAVFALVPSELSLKLPYNSFPEGPRLRPYQGILLTEASSFPWTKGMTTVPQDISFPKYDEGVSRGIFHVLLKSISQSHETVASACHILNPHPIQTKRKQIAWKNYFQFLFQSSFYSIIARHKDFIQIMIHLCV